MLGLGGRRRGACAPHQEEVHAWQGSLPCLRKDALQSGLGEYVWWPRLASLDTVYVLTFDFRSGVVNVVGGSSLLRSIQCVL